ncbi:GNAT family N-acetyltransferase [Acinetobacter variabilis]|uniref:GNAT family N-acetyltransferase n=1 Tax=Acinetobacter variabilis TaxID=70346 RepID=UPI002673ECB6|nr:GNAT family protein [Acinetobacter variabilis]WKT73388.1 GNAT family protein [Acinetobacter variabilis]
MRLRQLSENDLSIRVRWMNDARIYSTMHFTPPILLSNTIQWFDCNKNNNKRKDFVLETFEGKLLTMSGLTGLDENILKMESYIFVDPDTKARGLGKKTIFLQCLYAFEILKINKVFAYIDSDNFASQKLYEKIGFKKEGALRCETKRKNKLIDRYYYGCFKEDLNISLFQYHVNHKNEEIILL